jgi:hypothetical protein
LTPASDQVPEGDWYCPECKTDSDAIVKVGETRKLITKKMQKMPSAKAQKRWGGGNSCAGVLDKCTIVPTNHFGPIPGVEVGTNWRFRKQAAGAGVHRPLVTGIHGRSGEGAFSVVVAGGYEDDEVSKFCCLPLSDLFTLLNF